MSNWGNVANSFSHSQTSVLVQQIWKKGARNSHKTKKVFRKVLLTNNFMLPSMVNSLTTCTKKRNQIYPRNTKTFCINKHFLCSWCWSRGWQLAWKQRRRRRRRMFNSNPTSATSVAVAAIALGIATTAPLLLLKLRTPSLALWNCCSSCCGSLTTKELRRPPPPLLSILGLVEGVDDDMIGGAAAQEQRGRFRDGQFDCWL